MALRVLIIISSFLLFFIFHLTYCEVAHKKFEYKYSFKGPYLGQKDGSVPFWTYGGSAIASEESVRITPSLRSKKGFIWSKNKTDFDWWDVEFIFRVTGRGRIGADGLAFWYTDEPGQDGPVFGSSDRWRGLGIFFDSFDNDNKHNNPYIMAMLNDGQIAYDHQNDGISQQLSGCLRDYRNKPFAVRAKIEYYMNTLTLLFHNGMTDSDQDYEICFRAENVVLPTRGYFGLSAATGGLADDHDILKFLTSSLLSPEAYRQQLLQPAISETEKDRLAREFEDYRKKLEDQKEEYQKQHPDQVREPSGQEEWFESQQQQELRQIFTGQSRMFELIRELHRKMDEIIGRQERTLSMISSVQPGQPISQGGTGAPVMVDTIRRHEVDAVLNNQREIANTAREIKSFVNEIHKRGSGQPGAQPTGASPDFHNMANEMREGLNIIKRDLTGVLNKEVPQCPNVQASSCLSTTIFLTFAAIQLILTIGYLVYRDNREAQAKKFY